MLFRSKSARTLKNAVANGQFILVNGPQFGRNLPMQRRVEAVVSCFVVAIVEQPKRIIRRLGPVGHFGFGVALGVNAVALVVVEGREGGAVTVLPRSP